MRQTAPSRNYWMREAPERVVELLLDELERLVNELLPASN
jgi:hypothetical protein